MKDQHENKAKTKSAEDQFFEMTEVDGEWK